MKRGLCPGCISHLRIQSYAFRVVIVATVLSLSEVFAAADDFVSSIQPLLESSCIHCHDADTETPLAGRVRLLMNLVPLILQSDSSRIISVVIQDHQVVPTVDGVELEHHNLSHHGRDPVKIAQLKKIETQIVKQFGDLLTGLKNTSENGGHLLDSTSVLFGSNLGNANAHDDRNLPIFFAGGKHRHGQYLAYDLQNNTPLSNLFVRMLNTTGLPAESFATSTGELTWS